MLLVLLIMLEEPLQTRLRALHGVECDGFLFVLEWRQQKIFISRIPSPSHRVPHMHSGAGAEADATMINGTTQCAGEER